MTRLGASLAFCAFCWSCGGERNRPVSHGQKSLLASVELTPAFVSPARYRYHPTRRAEPVAEHVLSDGRRLLVGKRGERWLVDPRTHTLAAAANLAPEDLIAVLESEEGFSFIGQSGTSYQTREPLTKFERSSAPLTPFSRVSAAGHSILGIATDHSLGHSTDGAASFNRVGPVQVSFADVALSNDGTALALAIPEALWLSRDEGASWAEISDKTHGAFALQRDREGRLRIETVLGPYHFVDRPPRLEPGIEPSSPERVAIDSTPRGPDAAALSEGRAVLIGSRYLEVSASPAHPSDYELVQGPIDGKLESGALPQLKECRSARLTGFGANLELACFLGPSEAGSVRVLFFRSDDAGRHFEPEPFTSFGTVQGFRFALGAGGALIATGLCGSPGAGCSTGGIFVRRAVPGRDASTKAVPQNKPGRPKFELFASATPTLTESALALTFSLDGRTSYALGRRSKSSALAMFVSHDSGNSFEVHELDLVRADAEDEDQYWEHTQASLRVESFAAAEDGSLAVVLGDRRGRTLLVTDEHGRLVSGSKAPEEGALLAGVGMRAFAFSPKSRKSWESMDGGVTFRALSRFPVALCTTDGDCDVKLSCTKVGCVIGNEVSRIGWGGESEDDATLPAPAREARPLSERKVRMPIACTLGDALWQTLPGVRELPNSHDAAFGTTSFIALASDSAHASAAVIHGIGGAHPHLETQTLLAPITHPKQYAFVVMDQVEGGAALRYRLPEDPAKDAHLRNVEVAWDNALLGQVARAKLADGGPVAPADYGLGDTAQHADPDLLSIGEGGLYLRLHHNAADAQDTWFFDGRSSTRIPAVAWPIANGRGRTEMARSENNHVPLMIFGRGTAIARARRVGSEWQFDAETTGLPDPSAFGQTTTFNVGYRGHQSGLYLQTQTSEGLDASGIFRAFRASGRVLEPPIVVPTQANLAERPNRCTPSDSSTTPRSDAMFLPGTRHPVLVTDNSDPPRLFLSSGAVLYGTQQNACATAYDADEVAIDNAPLRHERALLLLDDLDHAWLFRSVADASNSTSTVQYRTMKCRFEPGLEVPGDVYRAPGTLVPRGG